jgi:glycosyltransferase involved in cell wall biosynthesis
MNIAHVAVNFPPHIGGIGEVCFSEAHGLALRGHEVTVFSLRQGPESRSTTPLSKVKTAFLRPLVQGGDAGLVPQLFWRLYGFDIVHLHYPFYGGAEWVWLSAALRGVKYVVTYHMDAQPEELWKKPFKRLYDSIFAKPILRNAQKVIIVGEEFLQETEQKNALDHKKIAILPNAVDTEVFYPTHTYDYESLGLDRWRDKDAILFVGNLMPLKRLDILLRALERLPSRAGVIVVGGGYDMERYQKMAVDLNIAARVLFVGPCFNQRKLAQYYNIASVVVVPSDYESFSLVTVEAQASGTIVVASAIPALKSKITDGIDGFLFQPGSVESLAQKINQALCLTDAQKRSIEKAARQRVQKQFALEPHFEKLEKIYTEALVSKP